MPKTKKPGRGRPKLPAGGRGQAVNSYLRADVYEFAKRLGNGSASAGVREIVTKAYESQAEK